MMNSIKMRKKIRREYYYLLLIIMIIGIILSEAHAIDGLIGDQTLQQKNHILQRKNQGYDQVHHKLLLFIIDFKSFMCPSCLDSFLEFYHTLGCSFEEGMIWGILVFDKPSKMQEEDLSTKIIEKKLRGFIKANNIKFPIIIDRFHIFKGLSQERTAVIVFDRQKKAVKKYVFPLKPMQIKEIIEPTIH